MNKVLCEEDTNSWHLNAIEVMKDDIFNGGFIFKCPICKKYIKHFININNINNKEKLT